MQFVTTEMEPDILVLALPPQKGQNSDLAESAALPAHPAPHGLAPPLSLAGRIAGGLCPWEEWVCRGLEATREALAMGSPKAEGLCAPACPLCSASWATMSPWGLSWPLGKTLLPEPQ